MRHHSEGATQGDCKRRSPSPTQVREFLGSFTLNVMQFNERDEKLPAPINAKVRSKSAVDASPPIPGYILREEEVGCVVGLRDLE